MDEAPSQYGCSKMKQKPGAKFSQLFSLTVEVSREKTSLPEMPQASHVFMICQSFWLPPKGFGTSTKHTGTLPAAVGRECA